MQEIVTDPILPYAGKLFPLKYPSYCGVRTIYTSQFLASLSLTISLSSFRSFVPLSVKTTIKLLGEAFCSATSRPCSRGAYMA